MSPQSLPRLVGVIALLAWLGAGSTLPAQSSSRDPRLGYAYPAGGQQGEVVEVVVGGQFLESVDAVHLSGQGVACEVLKWRRPLSQGEYMNLMDRLEEARDFLAVDRGVPISSPLLTMPDIIARARITDEQIKEMAIFRRREADPRRQPNDQLEEEVTLRLTIAPDAPCGRREIRLTTPTAMSNPLWIQIGAQRELQETEPNDELPDAAIGENLPVVVNGQVFPGDVDRFAFRARRGARLVISASVRELIPYLADAVPGWFQAVLTVTDAAGREVAYADSFHFRQDPVLFFEAPDDGEYTLAIRDSIFRGREDFVYRVTLGELPFVTGTYPLGARAREDVTVELLGWNLTQPRATLRPIRPLAGVPQWFEVPQPGTASVRVPLFVDRLTEFFDKEPNDVPALAQPIEAFAIMNGRIDAPGDVDVYRFEGQGRIAVNVVARQAGSPLDSTLTIMNEQGEEIGFNDDHEDRSQGLATHHADSHLQVRLPGEGAYLLKIADAQGQGGSDFVYRMTMTLPRPDFELRVTPSCIVTRPGSVNLITVYAIRHDGFEAAIDLSLVDAPAGLRLDGAVIPTGTDQLPLTLTIPPDFPAGELSLNMQGSGGAADGRRVNPALPAERMTQAFLWQHLVPSEEWTLVTSGDPAPPAPAEFPTLHGSRGAALPRVRLRPGQSTAVPIRITRPDLPPDQLRLELRDAPAAIVLDRLAVDANGVQVVLRAVPEKSTQTIRGNLIFQAFQEWTPAATTDNPKPEPQRTALGLLPAAPFELVVKSAPRTSVPGTK